MATLPPESTLPRDHAAPQGAMAPAALEAAWVALHRQADALAALAQIAAEPAQISAAFATLIANARPWQRTLVQQGIADNAAMLASGLRALSTLSARGQDTAAPALALWREFHAARGAVLAILQIGNNA